MHFFSGFKRQFIDKMICCEMKNSSERIVCIILSNPAIYNSKTDHKQVKYG